MSYESNLPPGVTESSIPGNRPEDQEFENVLNWVAEQNLSSDQIICAIQEYCNNRNIVLSPDPL